MSDNLKVHLISAANTFLSAFILAIGITLTNGGVQWNAAFWAGVILAAARAAIKPVIAQFVPIKLGGKR